MPAATAAAEPLEDPPGVRAGLWGFRVLPGARPANSVVTVLPITTAPAARSMATTVASREGARDRKSTRLNSSHSQISYAVFCLKKKKKHDLIDFYAPRATVVTRI